MSRAPRVRRGRGSRVALAARLVLLAGCAGCQPDVPTVPGPESSALLASLQGQLVWEEPRGGIRTLQLPAGTPAVVRAAAARDTASFPVVLALGGPDELGRIAYLEEDFSTGPAASPDPAPRLKTIRLDGTADTVVARWAAGPQANGARAVGVHLALSRRGGHVLLLRDLEPRQWPGSLLYEGRLELWNVDDGSHRALGLPALEAPLVWLPDGERFLACVGAARSELPTDAPGLAHQGDQERTWDRLPALYCCEVATGRRVLLGIGTEAAVAPDGSVAWIGGYLGQQRLPWVRVDLVTGAQQPVAVPGLAGRIVAAASAEVVLYQGWPTAGTEVRWTAAGSRPGGVPLLSIKAAHLGSQAFATILPYLDPRSRLSFGPLAR